MSNYEPACVRRAADAEVFKGQVVVYHFGSHKTVDQKYSYFGQVDEGKTTVHSSAGQELGYGLKRLWKPGEAIVFCRLIDSELNKCPAWIRAATDPEMESIRSALADGACFPWWS
jgi:hypothetical protein